MTKIFYIKMNGRYELLYTFMNFSINNGLQQYQEAMGGAFSLFTAFSREGPNKVYVQHHLEELSQEVNQLLEQGAYFYVCGDAANMAREVNIVLGKIISKERGLTLAQGEDIVKRMRVSNLYQVSNPLFH